MYFRSCITIANYYQTLSFNMSDYERYSLLKSTFFTDEKMNSFEKIKFR